MRLEIHFFFYNVMVENGLRGITSARNQLEGNCYCCPRVVIGAGAVQRGKWSVSIESGTRLAWMEEYVS